MGGMGSGRHSGSGKATTSEYRRIDVRNWARGGWLIPGRTFSVRWFSEGEEEASIAVRTEAERVILSYAHGECGENWQRKQYPVLLQWTECQYGGSRAWFLCPVRGCGRRVAILYGGTIFACRQCHHLVYQSQRQTLADRALARAQAIRVKLGGSACMADDFPPRPKGMHRRTYLRLVDAADKAEAQSWPPWLSGICLSHCGI